jgi:hypothetical protein
MSKESKDLFNNLQVSILNRQNILNIGNHNLSNMHCAGGYNETVVIEVKHARKKICGFKDNPYHTHHNEIRFNHTRYENDLANANRAVQFCTKAVNEYISKDINKYNNITNTIQCTKNSIISLSQEITGYKNKLNYYNSYDRKIVEKQQLLKERLDYLKEATNKILSNNKEIQNNNEILNSLTNSNKIQLENNSEKKQHLKKLFESKSQLDLAKLMFEYLNNNKMKEIVSIIESVGYSPDYLAYLAIKNNNLEAFKHAVKAGMNCDLYSFEGKTLLEMILTSDKKEFIDFALKSNNEVYCTILSSAKNNDIKVIKKLHDLDNNIFKNYTDFSVFTPFQMLLFAGEAKVAQEIISLDKSCLDVKSKEGESCFAISLRSSSSKVIEMLLGEVDLQKELISLIDQDQGVLIKKVIKEYKIELKNLNEICSYALLNTKLFITEIILENGVDIKEFAKFILSKNDEELFKKLLEIDEKIFSDEIINELLQEDKLDEEIKEKLKDILSISEFSLDDDSIYNNYTEINEVQDFEF